MTQGYCHQVVWVWLSSQQVLLFITACSLFYTALNILWIHLVKELIVWFYVIFYELSKWEHQWDAVISINEFACKTESFVVSSFISFPFTLILLWKITLISTSTLYFLLRHKHCHNLIASFWMIKFSIIVPWWYNSTFLCQSKMPMLFAKR